MIKKKRVLASEQATASRRVGRATEVESRATSETRSDADGPSEGLEHARRSILALSISIARPRPLRSCVMASCHMRVMTWDQIIPNCASQPRIGRLSLFAVRTFFRWADRAGQAGAK